VSDASAPLSEDDLLKHATRLALEAGLPNPIAIQQMAGGKNNRVFRLEDAAGKPFVLKQYYRDARDPRDRLDAEWRFIAYAWDRGVRQVPEPYGCDAEIGLGLYAYVGSVKLKAEALTADHVRHAADFIADLNRPPRDALALKPGSEACFSVADHLSTIDRRIGRLAQLDPDAPNVDAAWNLIDNELRPAWAALKAAIEAEARGTLDEQIPQSEKIASPSDFGFHNALWDPENGVSYIDFEYAGWDDPAKLAGDFFSCPEVPVPGRWFDHFAKRLCERMELAAATRERIYLMRPAYKIKWACIVLNDFLPGEDARRRFALSSDRAERCAAQLQKARALIADIGTADA